MKSRVAISVIALSLLAGGAALAQEHWTEGPVWSLQFYRTNPGHFDDYLKYIRQNYVPQTE